MPNKLSQPLQRLADQGLASMVSELSKGQLAFKGTLVIAALHLD